MPDLIDFPAPAGGDPADFEIDFDDASASPAPGPRTERSNTAIDAFFDEAMDVPAAGEDDGPYTVLSAEDVMKTVGLPVEPPVEDFVIEFDDEVPVPAPAAVPAPEPVPAAVAVPPAVPLGTPAAPAAPVAAVAPEPAEDDVFGDWDEFVDEDSPSPAPAPAPQAIVPPDAAPEPAAASATQHAPAGTSIKLAPEDRPAWLREVLEKSQAGVSHSFLLDFNIRDYAYRRIGVRDLATHTLNQLNSYHVVAYYNIADGLHFPAWGEEMYRERLLGLLGRREKIEGLLADEVVQAKIEAEARNTGRSVESVRREYAANASGFPEDPAQVLELLRPLFERQVTYDDREEPYPCILLWVDSVESILPDQPLSQMKLEERKMLVALREISASKAADAMGNCLVVTAESSKDVQETLRYASTRMETVTVPLPDRKERLAFALEDIAPMAADGSPLFSPELDEEVFANLSAGLSRTQMEDIALRALAAGTGITEQLVKERKADIISSEYADVIEILDPFYSFEDVGDLEHVTSYFRDEVIDPIRRGDSAMVPQGILLVGPPGTGKTMVAQALARESRMNCVNLNLSKILDRWVGSSERNFEKALRCIVSMEPTIVIVEEIDQAFPTRGADSTAVGNRIFKRFLEFMSDPERRGRVLVLATSNYPSRMDPALRRPGRFDKKIPFLVPSPVGRLKVMGIIARRMDCKVQLPVIPEGQSDDDFWKKRTEMFAAAAEEATLAMERSEAVPTKAQMQLDLQHVITRTEGMTGAEIETIMQKAVRLAYRKGETAIRLEYLKQASDIMVPSTSAIGEMTDEALRECNDLEFVPQALWGRVRSLKETVSAGTVDDRLGTFLTA